MVLRQLNSYDFKRIYIIWVKQDKNYKKIKSVPTLLKQLFGFTKTLVLIARDVVGFLNIYKSLIKYSDSGSSNTYAAFSLIS